jgi:hypothetical protein
MLNHIPRVHPIFGVNIETVKRIQLPQNVLAEPVTMDDHVPAVSKGFYPKSYRTIGPSISVLSPNFTFGKNQKLGASAAKALAYCPPVFSGSLVLVVLAGLWVNVRGP